MLCCYLAITWHHELVQSAAQSGIHTVWAWQFRQRSCCQCGSLSSSLWLPSSLLSHLKQEFSKWSLHAAHTKWCLRMQISGNWYSFDKWWWLNAISDSFELIFLVVVHFLTEITKFKWSLQSGNKFLKFFNEEVCFHCFSSNFQLIDMELFYPFTTSIKTHSFKDAQVYHFSTSKHA